MTSRQSVKAMRTLLGLNLRLARVRRDMSQQELADKVGTTAAHISNIERGTSSPTVDMLTRLAEALGQPASKLLVSAEE